MNNFSSEGKHVRMNITVCKYEFAINMNKLSVVIYLLKPVP